LVKFYGFFFSLVFLQAKIRKMVEENRQMSSRIEGDIHSHDEMVSLRDELNDTGRRMEHLNIKASNEVKSNNSASMNAAAEHSSSSKSSKSSKNFDDMSPVSSTPAGAATAHKFLNASSHRSKYNAYQRDNSSSSSNGGGGQQCLEGKDSNLVVDDTNYVNRRKSKKTKSKHHARRRTDLDFRDDTEPPSPTPGPSSRNDFGT